MNEKHLSDIELTSAYYDEDIDHAEREHLAMCDSCTARLDELKQTLSVLELPEAPEREYGFELKMWRAVEERIAKDEKKRSFGLFTGWRPWALGTIATALLVVAFFAGRYTSKPAGDATGAGVAKTEQRRDVLDVALAEHFDDSQRLLVELTHVENTGAVPDASQRAEELLASNRLYRQAAQQNGDKNVAQVLDQLERVLMQVAHEGETPTVNDQQEVGEQVLHTGLLFKVRVMASAARQTPKQNWANTDTKGQKKI
jgi:predicted anti-sigma-YlaC factor YlaD